MITVEHLKCMLNICYVILLYFVSVMQSYIITVMIALYLQSAEDVSCVD